MRRALPWLFSTALLSPCAGHAVGADNFPCEGGPTGLGSGELACTVDTRAGPQARRFEAEFSGVHDDSQAGMVASLDGAPLACVDSSRDRIQGEDDGSRLSCRLVIPADGSATARKVVLRLRWHHAEPVHFRFVPDGAN